ncbi:MAG TPA: clostripain-related cysteine peptidase [Candidatus Wallbacteria bacterium]|nr:clostripain-related cysteine peptidase [Candidatus Wallbacteria bacterium]
MKKVSILVSVLIVLALATSVFAQDTNTMKKWTFMVFVNADNNLDRFGILDMQEMEKAGLSKDVNIVTQIDRSSGKPARRYEVTGRDAAATADDWGLVSKKIQDLGEVDMGDYKELVNFVKWSHDNYPAEKYILVIWNHGAGWKNKADAPVFKGVSYDDQSGHNISTKDLGMATAAIQGVLGQQLDILAFDACLMQMIEVSYEIRENVKYMVASEETEPGDGWAYDLVLTPLVQNSAMTAEEFAKLIPQAYAASYGSKGKSTTQSAVDCSKLDEMAKSINNLALAIKDACAADTAEIKAAKDALAATQKYAYADNIDLVHFTQMLAQVTKSETVKQAINDLTLVFGKTVIQNNITGMSTKNSTGMAIYFPKSSFNSKYDTIKFSQFSWDEMVKAVTGAQAVAEAPAPSGPSTTSGGYTGGGYNDYPDVYPGGWGHNFPGGFHPMPPMMLIGK